MTRTYSNRTVIDVTGPAYAVERAFSTRMENVRHADGSVGYANATGIALPAELQRTVFGVTGFDNARFKTFNHRGRRGAEEPGPLQGPDTGLGPIALETSYDMPVLHGYDGTGQATGVVIDADFLNSDLSKFLKYFNVKRTGPATVRVLVDGGPPPGLTACGFARGDARRRNDRRHGAGHGALRLRDAGDRFGQHPGFLHAGQRR